MNIHNFFIKKQNIVAIIIMVITIIITNKFWLLYEPLILSFDIKGKGVVFFETQINKKYDDEFKKIEFEKNALNLDDTSYIEFHIDKIKTPKRIRIILSPFVFGQTISISNIQLKNKKIALDNLDKFKVVGANSNVQDGKLNLIPQEPVISITSPEIFNLNYSVNFNFGIFVIILILSYLLGYILSVFIADFKSIQGKSRIKIMFLILFFIMLFIPMSHINNSVVSQKENRTLARWQPLINYNKEINFNFGNDFNKWFQDRFNFRETLYSIYHFIKYKTSSKYYNPTGNTWINMENNWFINIKYCRYEMFTQEQLQEMSSNLQLLQEFCKANNIKPYILIPPYKGEFCTKLAAPTLFDKSMYSRTMQAIEYLKKHNDVEIIYPYEEVKGLFEKSPSRAYFKSDHHWTDEAAYLGYVKLMKQVKQDFPSVHITGENEYNFIYSKYVRVEPAMNKFFIGITAKEANIKDERFLDSQYKYYIHKNNENMKFHYLIEKDKDISKYFYQNNIKAPKMYMYGDSSELNLLPSIVNSFSDSQILFTSIIGKNILKLFEQDIIDNDTNVLIICVFDIDRLANLYKEK